MSEINSLKRAFNDQEVALTAQHHLSSGGNNYKGRMAPPTAEALLSAYEKFLLVAKIPFFSKNRASVPVCRFIQEEFLALLYYLEDQKINFAFERNDPNNGYQIVIQEDQNPHFGGTLISQFSERQMPILNNLMLNARIAPANVPEFELKYRPEGIFLTHEGGLVSRGADYLEAQLKSAEIIYETTATGEFGDCFLVNHGEENQKKLAGLNQSFGKDRPLTGFHINQTRKGLYIPLQELREEQVTKLKDLLGYLGIPNREHHSSGVDNNGKPLGLSLVIPYKHQENLQTLNALLAEGKAQTNGQEMITLKASIRCQAQLSEIVLPLAFDMK